MDQDQELCFDLEPVSFRFSIKKDGKTTEYVLKETSEETFLACANHRYRNSVFDDSGKVIGNSDPAGNEAVELGLSLFRADCDSPVGEEFVRLLPKRVAQFLVKKLDELNGVDKDPKAEPTPISSNSD